jgi:hypothetical protein
MLCSWQGMAEEALPKTARTSGRQAIFPMGCESLF